MSRLKLTYDIKHKKLASTLVSLGLSEFEAAETLIEKELYRESVVHMYFTCFYLTQSLLVGNLRVNPSHKSVEAMLHKVYGRSLDVPKRYIDLHTELHSLRTTVDYRTTHVPSPAMLKRKLRVLRAYVHFTAIHVPKVETLELLADIYEANRKMIRDL